MAIGQSWAVSCTNDLNATTDGSMAKVFDPALSKVCLHIARCFATMSLSKLLGGQRRRLQTPNIRVSYGRYPSLLSSSLDDLTTSRQS